MYIDVHCHLTGREYDELGGIEAVLAAAKEEGVTRVICSGFDLASSIEAKKLSDRFENFYFCAGFHPGELNQYAEGDLEKIRALTESEKCVAVGEIGLDYHFEDNPAPALQRELFIKQLRLANEVDLPVVLHSRDAAQETLEILQTHKHLLKRGGLMHCYSYSPEMIKDFLALGLRFSFGGPCTFNNAKKAQACVQILPKEKLLSETDCPYLTPVPHRGEFPNQPKNVKHVVAKMAALRNEEEEALKTQILQNAKELFFRLK